MRSSATPSNSADDAADDTPHRVSPQETAHLQRLRRQRQRLLRLIRQRRVGVRRQQRRSKHEADGCRHGQAFHEVPAARRDVQRVAGALRGTPRESCGGRGAAAMRRRSAVVTARRHQESCGVRTRARTRRRTSTVSMYCACSKSGKRARSGFSTSTRLMVPCGAEPAGASASVSALGQRRCDSHGALER
jgi:hypothetical protein